MLSLLSIGYMLGKREQERRFADHLIGQMSLSVGALLQLERGQYANAKNSLSGHIDIDIFNLAQLESVELDDASKEIRARVLRGVAKVRSFDNMRGPLHPNALESLQPFDEQVKAYVEKYQSEIPSMPAPGAPR